LRRGHVIRAFAGTIAMLVAAAGASAGPAVRAHSAAVRPRAEGTSSTPGVFALPQLGSAGITCGRDWTVRPFFYAGRADATEEVTIRAGAIERRSFALRVPGRRRGKPVVERELSPAEQLALPFGHYGTVVFTVRQGTEAREIVATVRAEVVAGTFKRHGVSLGACYVTRWSIAMNVSPY